MGTAGISAPPPYWHGGPLIAASALVGLGASVLALSAAPLLMPASYSWIANTTSESAAQRVEGGWLARLGFLLFGLSVIALAFLKHRRWGWLGSLLHYGFGASMTAAAAFSTRPWTGDTFDRAEDALHSVAATAMGFAFAAGVVVTAVRQGRRARPAARIRDISVVAASVLMPLAMAAWPAAEGVIQRCMFAMAYLWYAIAAIGDLRTDASARTTG